MSEVRSTARGSVFERGAHAHGGRIVPRRRDEGGPAVGWLVAGAAALAVGYLAWRHFAPDYRRYVKMRSM